jgi:hypothetical protein
MLKPKIKHGTSCYPGGRSIEVVSDHPEWTAWAVRKLYEAATLDRAERVGWFDKLDDWLKLIVDERK